MIRHIVWYLDLSQAELEMLERVAEFAARHGARLRAVFIEDESLLRSAELPCTREVSLTTGRVRELDPERIRLQLRRRREHIRQRLQQLARNRALEWSLEVEYGRREQLLARPPASRDEVPVLVLDPATELPTWDRPPEHEVLLLSRRFRPVELVLAVWEEAARDAPVLARAEQLARQQQLPLWITVPAAGADELGPALEPRGLKGAMLPITDWSLPGVMAAASDRASLLVLHRDSPLLAGARMKNINAALLVAPEPQSSA
ncbi:hypothetical protein [Zobellella denitrificans]|jgi:hypothetical protein|uniref:Universal stress protein n=1 Tax=Zobellella denitrificans TaxID=347534 RepID=A0A291HRF0_9GAMM|nr:hypothetical protein [Zobellella denitrificans]ATG74725.1 hypothetical protein AN401_13360 [Zobellella denitrificans]